MINKEILLELAVHAQSAFLIVCTSVVFVSISDFLYFLEQGQEQSSLFEDAETETQADKRVPGGLRGFFLLRLFPSKVRRLQLWGRRSSCTSQVVE